MTEWFQGLSGWQKTVVSALAAVVVTLAIWGAFEYFFPSTASWRYPCVEGHTRYYTTVRCTDSGDGSPTYAPVTDSEYVCDRHEWQCWPGRDGTKICRRPMPGGEY